MDRNTECMREGAEGWRQVPSDLDAEPVCSSILSRRRATLWALVLESRSVPNRIEQEGLGWVLLVPENSFHAALTELRLYEEENRNWPPRDTQPDHLVENTLSTLSVLLLLATFFNITRLDGSIFGYGPVDWMKLGSAQAGKIMAGQWWRTVTALTLHSGVLHLLGNITIGGVFIVFLCRDLGGGLAWLLLLLSGVLGTLANAWFHPPYHTSVGASTLVFGAVGILGSIRLFRVRRWSRKRWFIPVAGALALLAILGTEGENTDIGAHLFGFVFGFLLGLAAAYFVEKLGRPGPRGNACMAFCAAVVPVVAWWAALISGR
ncbi:MAG TPA: rhomboid family intramembrane serine protease [Geobacteraceae bacterium]|nr:rhomboid family intramembrane serine protease [Geobacteraceae bacterium]